LNMLASAEIETKYAIHVYICSYIGIGLFYKKTTISIKETETNICMP
jgi:hypothetical protein